MCAACATSKRILELDANRALTIPLRLISSFCEQLKTIPLASIFESDVDSDADDAGGGPNRHSSAIKKTARGGSTAVAAIAATASSKRGALSLSSSVSSLTDIDCFAHFYTHFNGSARLFEIFDACDMSLWEQPLLFAHVFVFASVAHAERIRRHYPGYLVPLREVVVSATPTSDSNLSSFSLRLWCVFTLGILYFSALFPSCFPNSILFLNQMFL